MKFFKKLRKLDVTKRVLASLITCYIKFVWLTSRWEFIGVEYPAACWRQNKAMIACFWHGRVLIMFKAWLSSNKFHMLISNHSDGEIIARTTQNFGFGWIAGSSSKGGRKAFMTILKTLKNGESVGVTPDGPRGPRYHMSLGSIQMARLSGAPIFPVSYSSTRGIFMKSWDQFFFPLPFGRGVFVYGPLLDIANSPKSDEELRQELETMLRDLTKQADLHCGQEAP